MPTPPTTIEPRVSLQVEVPEDLHDALLRYLEDRPDWRQHRVVCAALSLFLMQNGQADRSINRLYLDSIFDHEY